MTYGANLADLVNHPTMWPTPTTQEIPHTEMELTPSGRRMSKNGETSHSLNLADVVRMWPTPNTLDGMPPKSEKALRKEMEVTRKGRSRPANLRDCVQPESMKMWPTPRANDAEKRGQIANDPRHGLPAAAMHWPTPRATDYKGPGKTGELRDRLDYAAERGGTKSKTYPAPETSGTLNPQFVEWLMGYPMDYTRVELPPESKTGRPDRSRWAIQ
jgi:hypothetical protein